MRRARPAGWLGRGVVGGALLGGSWYALRFAAFQRADVRAGDALRRASTPAADRLVTVTTDLGSLYAVAGIAAVLAGTGRRRTAADVLGLGAAAWAVAQQSKTRVRRARPYEADAVRRLIRPPTGSSFPSGHAAVAGAVTGLLAERSPHRAGRALLHAAGAYVAATRVYVGVHYPSDVIGGAGMGLALAAGWRGPVAATGRGLARALAGGGLVLVPPLARAAAAVALGVRLPRRRPGRRTSSPARSTEPATTRRAPASPAPARRGAERVDQGAAAALRG